MNNQNTRITVEHALEFFNTTCDISLTQITVKWLNSFNKAKASHFNHNSHKTKVKFLEKEEKRILRETPLSAFVDTTTLNSAAQSTQQ